MESLEIIPAPGIPRLGEPPPLDLFNVLSRLPLSHERTASPLPPMTPSIPTPPHSRPQSFEFLADSSKSITQAPFDIVQTDPKSASGHYITPSASVKNLSGERIPLLKTQIIEFVSAGATQQRSEILNLQVSEREFKDLVDLAGRGELDDLSHLR